MAINLSEFIKEEQNLRKVAKLLYFFLRTLDEVQSNSFDSCIYNVQILNLLDNVYNVYNVQILNLLDPGLQLANTKPANYLTN